MLKNNLKVLAIIPARGGSKSIPKKNIKFFAGKPLIAHIIELAKSVGEIDRVIVSTDSQEIAEISKRYGAEIPFIRPTELARDETPTLPVLQHAVKYLEEKENYRPNVVILLYATSPLLSAKSVSNSIKMLEEADLDSVISVVEDTGHYWIRGNNSYKRFYPKNPRNRQFEEPLYRENGALYLCKRNLLMQKNTLVGGKIGFLRMQEYESIDIDEPLDFELAEYLMNRKNYERSKNRG